MYDDKFFFCYLIGLEMLCYFINILFFNIKLKRILLVFLIVWGVGVGWLWGIVWFFGGIEEGLVFVNRL